MRRNHEQRLNRNLIKLDRSGFVEKVSRFKHVSSYRAIHRGSVEEQFNRKVYKEARSIHLAIERCQECDKDQLKSSIDKPSVEKCRGAVEIN